VRTRIVKADVSTPTAMRAPHEGPGMFALESAMDELAVALDLDPLELRLRNYAESDPWTASLSRRRSSGRRTPKRRGASDGRVVRARPVP
jgi:xanthine dehydrogenase YagR molybdenum-binding subunit